MLKEDLLRYIRVELSRGVSRETIKSVLLAAGWQDSDVKSAFAEIDRMGSRGLENASYSPADDKVEKKSHNGLFVTLVIVIVVAVVLVVAAYILGG